MPAAKGSARTPLGPIWNSREVPFCIATNYLKLSICCKIIDCNAIILHHNVLNWWTNIWSSIFTFSDPILWALDITTFAGNTWKTLNNGYISQPQSIKSNTNNFFSWTLKVGEKKVPISFFKNLAQEQKFGHFRPIVFSFVNRTDFLFLDLQCVFSQ